MLRDKQVFNRQISRQAAALFLVTLTWGILKSPAWTQTVPLLPKPLTKGGAPTRYLPNPMSKHALAFYGTIWGIDAISVKAVESGEIIRFSYEVVDPEKAKLLNDKTMTPFLIAPRAGIRLSVPTLEKVGQLRQTSVPETGKTYWMAFSNPGRSVKRGDRVDVMIGEFHAGGLLVE